MVVITNGCNLNLKINVVHNSQDLTFAAEDIVNFICIFMLIKGGGNE